MSATKGTEIEVRRAVEADIPAIAAIYAHHVERDTASFELTAPDEAEMLRRYRELAERGFPYVVASPPHERQRVAGYAYASAYRARSGYRYTVEDSVYVDPGWAGRGVGKSLLGAVIAACETRGYRQMVAIIGGSHNAASIALHVALRFEHAGVLRAVGRKLDRWIDTVLMQRALGPGHTTPPA